MKDPTWDDSDNIAARSTKPRNTTMACIICGSPLTDDSDYCSEDCERFDAGEPPEPDDSDEIEEAMWKAQVVRDHALRRVDFLRYMVLKARNELGVPDANYPAPVANAFHLLDHALKSDAEDANNRE